MTERSELKRRTPQPYVTPLEAASLLGMSPPVLQDTYRPHPPVHQHGAAVAIGQKGWYVLVANLTEDRNEKKKPDVFLVGVAGFEPATPASRT